jgi:hypothetical protein
MTYNRDISECIYVLYNGSEEYKSFSNILTQVHVDNNKLFSQIVFKIFLNEYIDSRCLRTPKQDSRMDQLFFQSENSF